MLPSRRAAATLLALAFCALAVAAALARRPHILVDDAAISFRYAKRFAQGLGLTYNDHEHVMGFSNPLYTLVLAGLRSLGADLEPATEWLNLGLYLAALFLSLCLAWCLSNYLGAALVGILLMSNGFFVNQMLSGMEPALAAVLGLLFFLLLIQERDVWAAVILGLAVTNKLDAGFLALAFFLAWVALYRTIPFRISLTAMATFMPWALFALFYYGSAVPNSLQTKMSIHSTKLAFNHWWIADLFRQDLTRCVLLVGLLFPLWPAGLRGRQRLTSLALALWFLIHAVAYSVVNLGDYYPWYLTVLFPSITILGSAFIARSLTMVKMLPLRVSLTSIALAVVAWWGVDWRQFRDPGVKSWEAFDNDRRLAGVFIDHYSDKDEVVASGFGWVAYEIDNPFDDGTGLNSRVMRTPVDYIVVHGDPPYDSAFSVPSLDVPGFRPLATFNLASDISPGHTWFTVFGRLGSRIARSGHRWLQYRLFELEADSIVAPGQAIPRLDGNDLVGPLVAEVRYRVVNHSQIVRIVYTPVLGAGGDRSGPVTFVVGVNGYAVHRHVLTPGQRSRPVGARLAGTDGLPEFRLSLTAEGATSTAEAPAQVRWKNVKVIIGDAPIDPARIYDATMRETWQLHNPMASGG